MIYGIRLLAATNKESERRGSFPVRRHLSMRREGRAISRSVARPVLGSEADPEDRKNNNTRC